MMVLSAAEDCIESRQSWKEDLGEEQLVLTPMLINAMITRMDRENMIEFSGMGVPMVVTCDEVSMYGAIPMSSKR